MNSHGKGALVAVAVAGLFGCAGPSANKPASSTAAVTASSVHCAGINSCKGTGACKGVDNACNAQNSCKGKGWVAAATAEECTGKGGTVAAN
jgi:hypothetical protein